MNLHLLQAEFRWWRDRQSRVQLYFVIFCHFKTFLVFWSFSLSVSQSLSLLVIQSLSLLVFQSSLPHATVMCQACFYSIRFLTFLFFPFSFFSSFFFPRHLKFMRSISILTSHWRMTEAPNFHQKKRKGQSRRF